MRSRPWSVPGNSGGPLVQPDGEVIGVVFSRSTTNGDIGYALASPGVSFPGGVGREPDQSGGYRSLRHRLTSRRAPHAGPGIGTPRPTGGDCRCRD